MKRLRWFGAEWPSSIRSLASRLKSRLYTNDVSDGFLIDRVRDSFLEARFIERIVYTELIADPFGSISEGRRVEYRQSVFSAFSSFPQLQTTDLPRSTGVFANRIAEVNQFTLAVAPITVDVLDWGRRLQRELGAKAIATFVQINDLDVGDNVKATIQVRGSNDVRNALSSLTKQRRFTLERMKLSFDNKDKTSLVVTSSGTARIETHLSEELSQVLRETLVGAVRR